MIFLPKLKKIIKSLFFFCGQNKFKLVYLHIEKSAGTSQRIFFFNNFIEDEIFWYGINSDVKQIDKIDIEGKKLLGGHRFYDFYNNRNYLYLAVVRDPIQSAISLYSYFITQEHHLENWSKKKGFDVNSFENTLNNCQDFRQRISNHQCRYFSANKTYADALNIIENNNFMIGSIPEIKLFNEKLCRSLHLTQTEFPNINKSKVKSNDKTTLSSIGLEKLSTLMEQDILLYDYIVNKYKGLYNNITQKHWSKFLKN